MLGLLGDECCRGFNGSLGINGSLNINIVALILISS